MTLVVSTRVVWSPVRCFYQMFPISKNPFCLLECKRSVALSEALRGLISGREVISVLISVVHLELSLGSCAAVLTPQMPLAVGVGLI